MKNRKKVFYKQIISILMAFVMVVCMTFPVNVFAAETAEEDYTNTFVGTINGEEVVGYLETAYKGYSSGIIYKAKFVTFDENGIPKYTLIVTVDKDTQTGSYSDADPTNYGAYKIGTSVYTEYNAETGKISGLYNFRDNAKWTAELTKAEYSDDGIFEATINGGAVPSRYTTSPVYTEVQISGTYNYQMGVVHPVMEAYQEAHPEYGSTSSSSGSSSSSSFGDTSSSSGSSSSIDHTCRTCGGTGSCKKCFGSGTIINSYNGKLNTCPRCHSSGNCAVCYGTGSVY